MNFESIIQEIQQYKASFPERFISNEQKENLIKVVSYVSSYTRSNNTQPLNLSLKQIKEITGCDDKQAIKVFIDVGFYLCGTKWGILKLVYHYSYYDKNTMYHHLIEVTEDEVTQANETGLLNNQELKRLFNNNPVYFNPKDIHISFGLNESWING
jgi:hypothetical protein